MYSLEEMVLRFQLPLPTVWALHSLVWSLVKTKVYDIPSLIYEKWAEDSGAEVASAEVCLSYVLKYGWGNIDHHIQSPQLDGPQAFKARDSC